MQPGYDAAYILSDLEWEKRNDKVELMLALKEEGYSRLFAEGKVLRIEEVMQMDGNYPRECCLLIDRLRLPQEDNEDLMTRLHSSVDSAFDKGNGTLIISKTAGTDTVTETFINRFEADGMKFSVPDEYLFSFNSPVLALPAGVWDRLSESARIWSSLTKASQYMTAQSRAGEGRRWDGSRISSSLMPSDTEFRYLSLIAT